MPYHIPIDWRGNMPQIKKDYKMLNCKLERPVADRLDNFVKQTGLSKTVTVEKALEAYIDKYEKTGKI